MLAVTLGLVLSWMHSVQTASSTAQDAAAKNPDQPEPPKPDKTEQSTEVPLLKKDQMWRNLPTKADLLTKPPFDWVVLKKDDTVLIVKPVQPRPNTLDQMAEKRKQLSAQPKPTRNAGEPQDAYAERLKASVIETAKTLKKLESIEVELPDTTKVSEDEDDASYMLNIVRDVSEVIHFEDIALKRVDLLLDQGELEDAYDLLLMLDRRAPGWLNANERLNRFLLLDAEAKLARGEIEPSFVLLEQTHARIKAAINSKDPQERYAKMGIHRELCSADLGKVIDALIEPAVQARDFRQARFHLARLIKLEA